MSFVALPAQMCVCVSLQYICCFSIYRSVIKVIKNANHTHAAHNLSESIKRIKTRSSFYQFFGYIIDVFFLCSSTLKGKTFTVIVRRCLALRIIFSLNN